MPGQVLDVKVKEGDTIKKGDTVLVLSAMKVGFTRLEVSSHSPLDGNRREECERWSSEESVCASE